MESELTPELARDIAGRFKLLCQFVNIKRSYHPQIMEDQARAHFLRLINQEPSAPQRGWRRTGCADERTFNFLFRCAWDEAGKLN